MLDDSRNNMFQPEKDHCKRVKVDNALLLVATTTSNFVKSFPCSLRCVLSESFADVIETTLQNKAI